MTNKLYTLVFHNAEGEHVATYRTNRTIWLTGWKHDEKLTDAVRCYIYIGSELQGIDERRNY